MVGHQYVCMNAAPGLARILAQPVQIKTIVFVGEKAGLAVVAPLDQVHRYVWKREAWATGHERISRMVVGDYKPWSVPYFLEFKSVFLALKNQL